MNRSRVVSLAAALGLVIPSHSGATVVYDGGAPDLHTGYFAALSHGVTVAATQVTFPTAITFNAMNWWGLYYPLPAFHDIPLSPDSFSLNIYRGGGSVPGDLLSVLLIGSGNRVATGRFATGDAEFAYTSSVPTTSLPAGTYFFGLTNFYRDNAGMTWAWETTASGAGGASLDTTSFPFVWRASTGENLAFQLEYTARQVPEPAPALLLGAALTGAFVMRRRSGRAHVGSGRP